MSSACLRIHSKSLSISTITEHLKMRPSRSFEKGTLVSPRNPRSERRESNLWIIESTGSDELRDQITHIVRFIESRSEEIKALSRECLYDIFCEFSSPAESSTLVLEADLIRRLQIVPIDLVIDVIIADS